MALAGHGRGTNPRRYLGICSDDARDRLGAAPAFLVQLVLARPLTPKRDVGGSMYLGRYLSVPP